LQLFYKAVSDHTTGRRIFYWKGRGYATKHNKEKKKVKALGKTMALLLAKERKTR
jgi:hypothetical protein